MEHAVWDAVAAAQRVRINPGDTAWVLASAALVMFMTLGLALFYGGMVRAKNVLGMLMQNFFCLGLISVVWATVTYSLAFSGDNKWIGNLDLAWLRDAATTSPTGARISDVTAPMLAMNTHFAHIAPTMSSDTVTVLPGTASSRAAARRRAADGYGGPLVRAYRNPARDRGGDRHHYRAKHPERGRP